MKFRKPIQHKFSIILLLAMCFLTLPIIAAAQGKIAFTSKRDGNLEIYVMNADGTNPVRLTNNPADDFGAVFSPDGSKIAFTSTRDGGEENWGIFVMNADGSNQTRLTDNTARNSFPSWSPDGSKISFTSSRDGDN